MPAGFTASLANRLNSLCHIDVKEASNGDILENGVAYIAPGGFHLKVKKLGTSYVIQTDLEEPRKGHRPSVNVMFESLSHLKNTHVIAVIMTGMGADGSEGLLAMKREGVSTFTIAESEETSVVFGMPKAAIKTNYVNEVVSLPNIAPTIIKHCSR